MQRVALAICGSMHHVAVVPATRRHHILVPADTKSLIVRSIDAVITVLALGLEEITRIFYTAIVAYPCITAGVYCYILNVAMHPVVALVTSYGMVAIVANTLGRRAVERCKTEQHMRRVGCRCANHHIEEALSTGSVHNG